MAQGLTEAPIVRSGYGCNSACRFCDQGDWRTTRGDRAADEVADAAVRAGQGGGVVVFSGGEVTMRPELAEWVRLARGAGAKRVLVQTNGRMLAYPGVAQQLRDAGVDVFAVALHGHVAELHDWLTRTEGSFEQAVKGVRRARQAGASIIVNTVVTRPGYRHLGEMAALLFGALGASGWRLIWPRPEGELAGGPAGLTPEPTLVAPHVARARAIAERAGKRLWLELPEAALAPAASPGPAPEPAEESSDVRVA